jgi:hypothetical protein
MTSKRTIKRDAVNQTGVQITQYESEAKLYTEDGWIFRERPGKGIECVSRYDGAEAGLLSQPNLALQDYPSR